MSGFAGWLRTAGPQQPVRRATLLSRMGAQLARRGPDEETYYDDGTLALVFRRLATVDRRGGRQPFGDETGTLACVVDGSVHNHLELRAQLAGRHRLTSQSDGEVAMHLYAEEGPAFLDRLHGSFALCVWDRARRRGLLARDRLGVKPLYVARLADGVLFGSELTALLAHPDCPRELAEEDLIQPQLGDEAYGTVWTDRVPGHVRGVDLLGPGEYLWLRPDRQAEPQRYWDLTERAAAVREDAGSRRTAEAWTAEYADLLGDSLHRRLVSDVPVGALLSGGLGSATVVAAAARRGVPLESFAVLEPTTVAGGDVARATGLARRLHLRLHAADLAPEQLAGRIDFGLADLERLVWALDAPRFGPDLLIAAELYRHVSTVRPDLRVVLLGHGADELAGGLSRTQRHPRTDWADYLRGLPDGSYAAELRRRLVGLQAHDLWEQDRLAAAWGIEPRFPYLDHRLVELLAGVPEEWQARLFFDKRIARDAAARWLPVAWREAPRTSPGDADDRRSRHVLMAACARRTYPDFRDAYGPGLQRWSVAELDAWCGRAAEPGAEGRLALRRLVAAMATAVFEAMLHRLAAPEPWLPAHLPSPLPQNVVSGAVPTVSITRGNRGLAHVPPPGHVEVTVR